MGPHSITDLIPQYLWEQQAPTGPYNFCVQQASGGNPGDPMGSCANHGDSRHAWHPVLSVGPQGVHGTLYYPSEPEPSIGTPMGP